MSLASKTFTLIALSLTPVAAMAGGLSDEIVETTPVAPTPVIAAGTDWTGFYVGGQYGLGEMSLEGDVEGNSVSDRVGDLTYVGGHAGYLYDLGAYVLGAEVAFSSAELDTDNAEAKFVPGDITLADLTLRAGYDAGAILPYGFAGLSQMKIDNDGDTLTFDGYTLGVGAAYAITENVLLGAEYGRRSYGLKGVLTEVTDLDFVSDGFALRASYKF